MVQRPVPDAIRSLFFLPTAGSEPVLLAGEKIKAVLRRGKAVLFVMCADGARDGVRWQTCPKELPKGY